MRLFTLLTAFCFCSCFLYGQEIVITNASGFSKITGEKIQILADSSGKKTLSEVMHSSGFKFSTGVPNFSSAPNNVWIKFSLKNKSTENKVYFIIDYANISEIHFYQRYRDSLQLLSLTGNAYPFDKTFDANVNFNFKIELAPDSTGEYFIHINSVHPLQLPIYVEVPENKNSMYENQLLVIGVYTGLIISILLYNLFLFFSTRDKSYLYYVIYLGSLLFAQLTFAGWSFKILWPEIPSFNTYAVVVSSSFVGITALLFSLHFLHIGKYSVIFKLLFYLLMTSYFFSIIGSFFISLSFSYTLLSFNGIIGGVLLLTASGYIARKGYRPAYYYFLAFFIFSLGRVILSLRNLNIMPYNNFSSHILYLGSAFVTLLLSFALAYKINILQKEKNDTQQIALKISKENAKLITEQNIVLEQKVTERTIELQNSNMQLSNTLNDLKDAQTQLVEAEKMASLGQLTAGIAHEINNPINFVKSNIKPLRLDIEDIFGIIDEYNLLHGKGKDRLENELQGVYAKQQSIGIDFVKNEIQQLIKGIEDGAERTAEIVRGLRVFSRLDEGELKTANVHDGLESTL
ncbi:MAG TPA: 7TM diverse intracellular signaling domain-containing protein, partial [Panacibacter sp.]|nr:7TM diverse intracellular signaling domain-containing protein [Panacibacter sp.]